MMNLDDGIWNLVPMFRDGIRNWQMMNYKVTKGSIN